MSEKLNYDQLLTLIQSDREADREQMKASQEKSNREMEEMRAHLRDTERTLKEAMMELRETVAEAGREMKESAAETDRVVKAVSQQLGGIGNSNGAMAEDYFFNSLDKSKMLGNEKFDYADRNVKFGIKDLRDEYDIVLYNCESVSIVEVKYNAEQKHIAQTINKATTFRQLFPMYKDFTFYLGIASLAFDKGVEKAALDAGLAVIKQVGDTMVVNDKQLKKF